MGDKSKIEWTDATWNPVTGCDKISSGCKNCYAERMSKRFTGHFNVTLHPDRLDQPLHWKKPRRIFVNSMGDLMHKNVPNEFIREVISSMQKADWHTYQILTKRPMRLNNFYWFEHMWIGTSVEDSKAKDRINDLREVRTASIHFVSFEPLIGSVGKLDLADIEWAIVGGESGVNHRPVKVEWIREIRDQCQEQGVPFFFKQWGGRTPKSGGNVLDGKTYMEYPKREEE